MNQPTVKDYAMFDVISRIGRNEMCACGSLKKFKHCCIKVHGKKASVTRTYKRTQ